MDNNCLSLNVEFVIILLDLFREFAFKWIVEFSLVLLLLLSSCVQDNGERPIVSKQLVLKQNKKKSPPIFFNQFLNKIIKKWSVKTRVEFKNH